METVVIRGVYKSIVYVTNVQIFTENENNDKILVLSII